MNVDCFKKAETLIKKGSLNLVLDCMLNMETGRIKAPFSGDLNHAWYLVGLIYYKHDDYDQALRAFKSSLRNWTEDAQAMLQLRMAILSWESLICRSGICAKR